ncbi:hypothetical protein OS493_013860 [Desmophyllum pertusum]|uniref:ShKT domain-containing protein n=1 Tax=Desmophyllum pertusum TaxID=174260 RepID=A0A9X0D440_9CNID|nr:hypothetical protein OS493_013860 [Desmophyllum pertusum]
MDICLQQDLFISSGIIDHPLISSQHGALKKVKYSDLNDDDKATRAKLLWDLILTRNRIRHKGSLTPRHLHNNLKVYTVPLKLGLCTDQHPLCSSFALNGLCDWPGLFQDLDNIHKTCAFSCGNCKKNISNGEVDLVGAGWNEP